METPIKKKRDRSAAYPASTLSEAVEAVRSLRSALGKGPYDRESAAKALGYSGVSGASAAKIAALVHYGFLERQGAGYKESEAATRIVNPLDDLEFKLALQEAFAHPTLFNKLLAVYGESALPTKLDVILERNYSIAPRVSSSVAQIFKDSAEYAGILENGFLRTSALSSDPSLKDKDTAAAIKSSNTELNPELQSVNNATYLPAYRLSNGVKVLIPMELMQAVIAGDFKSALASLEAVADVSEGVHDSPPKN